MIHLHKWESGTILKLPKTEHPCFKYTYISSVWLWPSRFSSSAIFHCSSGLSLGQNNLLTFSWLTVGMLVGQPVVFGILELEVGVAELALLGSEVFEVLGAVVRVAKLILVVNPRAVLAAIGGSAAKERMDKHQRIWADLMQIFGANKMPRTVVRTISQFDLISISYTWIWSGPKIKLLRGHIVQKSGNQRAASVRSELSSVCSV